MWTQLARELVHARVELEALLVEFRRDRGRGLGDERLLARQAELEERAHRAGWCLGVLGAAHGVDLLLARREADGLAWFVRTVAESRGCRLAPADAELPRTDEDGWEAALLAAWLAWQAQPTAGELRWTTGVRETERWLAFEVPASAELDVRCGELARVLAPALRLRHEPARGRLELGWSWAQRTTPPGGGAGVVAGVDEGIGPGVCSGGGGGP